MHNLDIVHVWKSYDLISLSYDVNSERLSISGDVIFTSRDVAESLDSTDTFKAAELDAMMQNQSFYDVEEKEFLTVCLVEVNYTDFKSARGFVDNRKKRKGICYYNLNCCIFMI